MSRLLVLASLLLAAAACFAACGGGSESFIQASAYDQTCASASDCASVFEGALDCCNVGCDNAAINKGALARYYADATTRTPVCPMESCPAYHCAPPPVACTAGKCQIAAGP